MRVWVFLLLVAASCSTDPFLTPDAALDAATDASLDAPRDAPDNEVTVSDVVVDAPCAPVMPSCPGALCTNFDVSPTYGPFQPDTSGSGASQSVVSKLFVSCPSSFFAALMGVQTNVDHAWITANSAIKDTSKVHAVIDLDLWLDTPVGAFTFVKVSAGTGTNVSFGVNADSMSWYVYSESSGTGQPLTSPPRLNVWNHVTLAVMFSAGSATLTYDSEAGTGTMVTLTAPLLTGGPAPNFVYTYVGLGASATTTGAAVGSAYYDNVVFSPL
jgi:hypothetical protein